MSDFIVKTRFKLNVNIGDIINFVLILFGFSVISTKILTINYDFNLYLCFVIFMFITMYFLVMGYLMYIFARDKKSNS